MSGKYIAEIMGTCDLWAMARSRHQEEDRPTASQEEDRRRGEADAYEDEFLAQLQDLTGLERPLLRKILEEIRAFYGRELPDWVRERHGALRKRGWRNDEIYPELVREAERARFAAGRLSERQIRRFIYG